MTPADCAATLASSIAEIDAQDWDSCAIANRESCNPFVTHAFLKALEESGSVGPGTGWLARHIVLREANGMLAAAAPCYVKTHSQGEYVFDHAWAEAYAHAGGRYYPKLQIAVPFTPVPGPRLLVKPGAHAARDEHRLATAAIEFAQANGFSSVHVTFTDPSTQARLAPLGFLARTGQQFHWQNDGYATFDDFLSSLASRKRKAVRKERAEALAAGISIEHVAGAQISDAHWDAMFSFYMDTGNRKWGRPYLNRAFFTCLGATMANRCLLVMARRGGRYIAGALNMIGGDCLYGRYWGAIEHHPSLHFELCYYQAIDYAIANRLARIEAGAQGEHKLARGYLPVETCSAHWIADPALARAVARYLVQERRAVADSIADLTGLGPYRKDGT